MLRNEESENCRTYAAVFKLLQGSGVFTETKNIQTLCEQCLKMRRKDGI